MKPYPVSLQCYATFESTPSVMRLPILVYVSIYNKRKASDGAAVTASVPDTDPGTGIEIQWTKLMNNQSRV